SLLLKIFSATSPYLRFFPFVIFRAGAAVGRAEALHLFLVALGIGILRGEFQLVAVGVGKIDRDARRAAVHLGTVEWNVQFLKLLQRGVHFVGPNIEGEMQITRAWMRRVFRVLHEKIEAVIPYFHERVDRPAGAFVFFVEAARAAYLAVEDVAIKRDGALEVFHHECDMIDSGLHVSFSFPAAISLPEANCDRRTA